MKNKKLFVLLGRLVNPWGLHVTYLPEANVAVVSGHTDYATNEIVAVAAGQMSLKLVIHWDKITTEAQLLTLIQQYLTRIMREFANAIENGAWKIVAITEDGYLKIEYTP